MICPNCKENYPNQFNTCPNCGMPSPPPDNNNGRSNRIMLVLVCILAGLLIAGAVVTLIVFSLSRGKSGEDTDSSTVQSTAADTKAAATTAAATEDNKVLLPDLSGLSEDKAIEYLDKLGLKYDILLAENDAAAGTVFKQSPSANDSVEKGSKVRLYIAKPKPVKPTAEATKAPTASPETKAPEADTQKNSVPYLIKVFPPVYIYASPASSSEIAMTLDGEGVYTIVEEKRASSEWWGKLKSGAGWVNMNDIIANGGYVM